MVFLRNWNSFRAWRSFQKLRYRNSATFKMEVFATIGNGRKLESFSFWWACKQWAVFACCCGNLTIYKGKIKIGWRWSCLEGGLRCALLFCRNIFPFFRKNQLLFVPLTFCLDSKTNYKNEKRYHCPIHLPGFY